MKVILLGLLAIGLSSCAMMQYATLNSAPSDVVLLSLKGDQYHHVVGAIATDIADPYVVTSNDGGQVTVNLNDSFRSQLLVYLRTKFYNFTTDSSAQGDSSYVLSYRLISANTSYRYNAAPLNLGVGEARSECTLVVSISVTRGGKAIGNATVTAPSSSTAGSTWRQTLGAAMNDAISKSIIMSDRFLQTVGL